MLTNSCRNTLEKLLHVAVVATKGIMDHTEADDATIDGSVHGTREVRGIFNKYEVSI